uniref:Uncharacterized protein n=1 Tax=Anguilla anguilla TaxID=7936 RepID=A0A0E9PLL1_ANGAN
MAAFFSLTHDALGQSNRAVLVRLVRRSKKKK